MRVILSLASLFFIGCCVHTTEAEPVVDPVVIGDASAESQGPGYMLAFPMDEAGMVAAESDPEPQVATLVKEVAAAGPVSSTLLLETKPVVKSVYQQPSDADRRRKIEEMRKILGLPANNAQKPKPAPIEKPKPLLFPSLMKVLPRLDSSPLSSLPLALIRRSDEEGPKMLHGLLRQAATVFMRRALLEDEPDVQDVSENKGKKDSLLYFLDDDKESEKKGSKDDRDDDDDDDDDLSFIPLPRPIPGLFRGGFPTSPFGLPRRPPQMLPRRSSPAQPFLPMGPLHQIRKTPPSQSLSPQGPNQPLMLILQPFMSPQPMMLPQPSVMQPFGAVHPPVFPHHMMLPPPPLPFHPHPFMPPHPMMVMPPHPMMMPPHPMMMPPHPMMMSPHPMMIPPHPMMMPPPPSPFFTDPHHHLLPHPPPFFMDPHHQFLQRHLPPQHPMSFSEPLSPEQVLIKHALVPEYHPAPVPVPVESQGESEESPFVVLYDDPQPRFHHQHHQSQQPPQQQEMQVQPQPQANTRSMPALLSPLRRMQMLRELIMARSLQMPHRAAFHLPVLPRITQGDRDAAQSVFRPIFTPMG